MFVAGLHLRWDGVWQRPHHLLTRLAQKLPVIVLEEPCGAAVDRDELRRDGALTVIRPLRRRGWGAPLVDAQGLATLRTLAGSRRCGAWLYTPMMNELIDAFDAAPVVYDAMDDLASSTRTAARTAPKCTAIRAASNWRASRRTPGRIRSRRC